jgi:laminin alpha 3/5
VVGEKCDQCPARWVFVPDYGCHQCDSCTHALLDTTDELQDLIDPIILEFDSANSGHFTRRKLENMRELLKELKPKFDEVDPKQISLDLYIEELETLEQDSKNLNRKANYSLENSDSLKTNAVDLKEKAEVLLNDVEDAEDASFRVIEGIKRIISQLKDITPEVKLAEKDGQEILDAIKQYNLTGRENAANSEMEKVTLLLTNVTNFKIPVDYLEERTETLKNNVKNFNDKLDDLYNQTQYSLNKANEAQRIIDKSGKVRLKKKLEDIENQTLESGNNLVVSQSVNNNSTKYNVEANDKLNTLRNILNDLESRNNEFNSTLFDVTALDEVKKLRPKVENYAKNLTARAMQLDGLLTESRDLSDSAVKAANAYGEIVNAVKNASVAADKAKIDATAAVNLLNGVENKTSDAAQVSTDALHDAFEKNRATNDDLKPRFEVAIEKYEPIKQIHRTNKDTLENVDKMVEKIQGHSLDQAYGKAADNADSAMRHVTNIKDIASETFDKVKDETENATTLPKTVDDMNRDLLQTQKQLNTVNEILPSFIETIDQIPEQQIRMQRTIDNIKNSIKKLDQQINLARDLANQIKIGMKFYPNTTLELKNPSNLEDLTTSTKISGYFRTNNTYGLLWYLGNPPGTNLRKTKTDDYMALIVQNGYPVLKLDVGNGVEQVINEKYVSDNVWYQFIVERTGDNAKLTIREEKGDGEEVLHQKETTLEGPLTIFNLHKNKSKLFVGSFPVNYDMQKEIDANSFDGEIEDLVIGEKPVSLWNFNNGFENNHGAVERDKLVNLHPSTGYRFNGNGYAVLDVRSYPFRSKSDIKLSFKTFATEGLLFLTGKGNTFIAIELRNGKILYQYNLGWKTKNWHTTKTYNDGKWHTVEAIRDGPLGRFTVDNEDIKDTTQQIEGTTVDMIETVSFGGYPSVHPYIEVTQMKFDGCIDNVGIMGSPIDLRNSIKAYDVTPGCPVKFSQMVSFGTDKPGYVAQSGLSVNNDFKISLKFKTKEKDGLIFYGSNQLRTANISLALRDGRLVLISQKSELVTEQTFNDNEWHVVSVKQNDEGLRLDFDDIEPPVLNYAPPPLHFLHGTLYIGGVPRVITFSAGTVGSEIPFRGCIGDLTLKGNVINFANTTDKFNEILGKCILDKNYKAIDKIDNEPTLPPLEPLEPLTTKHYQETTRAPYAEATTIRGDGGRDYLNKSSEEELTTEAVPPQPLPPTTEGAVGYPVPTSPKPPREDSCALPQHPPQANPGVYRFGAQKDSRLELEKMRGRYRRQFDFALDFKSDAPDGIIFYISDNFTHSQYVAVFLQNGRVVYTFSDGRSTTVIKTNDTYNYGDNKWHLIEFSRDENTAKLVLDTSVMYDKQVSNVQKIDIKPPLYVGGLDPVHYNQIQGSLNIPSSFSGCIRNVYMNSKPLEVEPRNRIGVVPCFDSVESGVFFPVTGGFVRLREPRFKVGEIFDVKLEIKPRRDEGVLIAVNGKKDFFVLEMIKGVMSLTVENGKGPIRATYNPRKKFYFCDGQWHTIQAVKSKNVVTLSVDNVYSEPTLGDHSSTSTDTGSALFLGGHRFLNTSRAKGIETRLSYVGCVKNVFINNDPLEIYADMAEEDVIVGTCPTN